MSDPVIDRLNQISRRHIALAIVLVVSYFVGAIAGLIASDRTWWALPAFVLMHFAALRANSRLHGDATRKMNEAMPK